jgi:uncharacterized protein (DUF488 family)
MRTILTIGHSTHGYENFLSLLRGAQVTAVADVRSSPFSRHQPDFNRPDLEKELRADKIQYSFLGEELGGRPRSKSLFLEGVADYEKMARTPEFERGIDRLIDGSSRFRIALMCSEHDPLDCHRCLLVGRALKQRRFSVDHILFNGSQKSQNQIEDELLAMLKQNRADFFPEDQIASAYRDRSLKVAYSELRTPPPPQNAHAAE